MKPGRVGWREWWTGWFRAKPEVPPHLRPPGIRQLRTTTELQFARGVSQSAMITRDPDRLLVGYTRTMLGALVFAPRPRLVAMVGLGGGSQAKYCYRHLPGARIEVVENNPHVIAMRNRFHVPQDDARLQVFLDDGARFLQGRRRRYDLLLVDGYDETGIPATLSTQAFHDDCRASLADGGVAAFNLYGAVAAAQLERLRAAFGDGRVLVVQEARQRNKVAITWTQPAPQDGAMALSEFARRDLDGVFAQVRALLDAPARGAG